MNRRNFLKTAGLTGIGCLLPVGEAEAVTQMDEPFVGYDDDVNHEIHKMLHEEYLNSRAGCDIIATISPKIGQKHYDLASNIVYRYDGKTWIPTKERI